MGKSKSVYTTTSFWKDTQYEYVTYFFLKLVWINHFLKAYIFLKIKELCDEYMGKYPVIFLSLKGIDGLTFEEAIIRITTIIKNEARRHHYLKNSDKLIEEEIKQFQSLLDGKADDITDSIRLLSELLCKHYGEKTIILIDEYDVPLDKAFQKGYYDEMVELMRGLLGQVLKNK